MIGRWKERASGPDTGQHRETEIAKTLGCFTRQPPHYLRSRQCRRYAQTMLLGSKLHRRIDRRGSRQHIRNEIDALQRKVWPSRWRSPKRTEAQSNIIQHALQFPRVLQKSRVRPIRKIIKYRAR